MVTRTYYEGQMPLEEEVIQGGSVQSLARHFLGGRGIEAITTTAYALWATQIHARKKLHGKHRYRDGRARQYLTLH